MIVNRQSEIENRQSHPGVSDPRIGRDHVLQRPVRRLCSGMGRSVTLCVTRTCENSEILLSALEANGISRVAGVYAWVVDKAAGLWGPAADLSKRSNQEGGSGADRVSAFRARKEVKACPELLREIKSTGS